MRSDYPVITVNGPTCTGKTGVAVLLAERLGGEVVSCDSMQIYRGLDIGTAKPTGEEMKRIRHHLVGFLDPSIGYSAADYVRDASKACDDIAGRGYIPILCGGTGMYVDALLRDGGFPGEERSGSAAAYDGETTEDLYLRLTGIDPVYAGKISRNDRRRIERALEVFDTTGEKVSDHRYFRSGKLRDNALLCVLTYRDRSLLYERIGQRVDEMLESGLIAEAEYVYENRDRFITAAQAIGYKELFPFIEGNASLEECAEKLKKATRNYAKRQMTWFRREEDAFFIEADGLKKEDIATIIEDRARAIELIP